MKKIAILMSSVILLFLFSKNVMALSEIDVLYKEGFEAVKICTTLKTQQSVNNAREVINKFHGKLDWAIGEFSKQIDEVQHPILVDIVDGINKNQNTPNGKKINDIRRNILALPNKEWVASYSSALDIAQDILIKNVADSFNNYKNDTKIEKFKLLYLNINELEEIENQDVINFTKTIEKETYDIIPNNWEVYVVLTGKCYHFQSDCSSMKNPIKISLKDAINNGYRNCKKC